MRHIRIFLPESGPDQPQPNQALEQLIELRIEYADGNGPQALQKLVRIAPCQQFVSRQWSIEDWPDASH